MLPCLRLLVLAATNGKHQWVPKEIVEAAEKHAKVCLFSIMILTEHSLTLYMNLVSQHRESNPQSVRSKTYIFYYSSAVTKQTSDTAV